MWMSGVAVRPGGALNRVRFGLWCGCGVVFRVLVPFFGFRGLFFLWGPRDEAARGRRVAGVNFSLAGSFFSGLRLAVLCLV